VAGVQAWGNIGAVAINIAGWVIGQIPDLWAWFTGTVLPGIGGLALDIGSVIVNVAGWVAGQIEDLWTWFTGWVMGGGATGMSGDGTGGARPARSFDLGTIAVNITGWAAGEIADLWGWVKATVLGGGGNANRPGSVAAGAFGGGGGLNLDSVVINILSWMRGSWADLSWWVVEQVSGIDLSAVGTTIQTKIMDAISMAFTAGQDVGEAVSGAVNIGTSLLTSLTTQIEGVDWNSLGVRVGELIGTAIIGAFGGTVAIVGLAGSFLGGILNSLADVEWAAVGTTFVDFLIAAVKALTGFATGLATGLGTEIGVAIAAVDWAAMGTKIKDALIAAVKGVGTAI
jgi:hypothetical protein